MYIKQFVVHFEVTMFPIKSHLLLISTRIEFKLKDLPPPPQITSRRDLGAHLRRQARHKSVPYSRPGPRHTSEEASDSDIRHVRFDSPLTPLPMDIEEREIQKIPKPKGEAGKSNSGGYNLKEALGWEEKRYNEFIVS
jgi:hypothetical protein